jgi:hypothetical protein
VVLLGDAALPPQTQVDVLWRVPADPGDAVWDDLARALGTLAAPRSSTAEPARREPSA